MTISDTIEQCFLSNEIIIDVAQNFEKEPNVFALVVSDINKAAKGYVMLHDHYKDRKITLLVHKNNDRLDISLVIKDTADTINIKTLKYDKTHFDNFLKVGTNDQRMAFVLSTGKHPTGGIMLLPINQMLSPILLDKYSIV